MLSVKFSRTFSPWCIPSHDTIKRRLKKVNQLTEIIQEYHVCPNGCYLYPKNDEVQTSCPNSECERPRYKNSLSQEPSQVMCVFSVAVFLADRLFDDEQREKFDYRHISDTEHVDGLYKDYNSGEVYRKFLQEQQGLFRGSRDIALIIVRSEEHTSELQSLRESRMPSSA